MDSADEPLSWKQIENLIQHPPNDYPYIRAYNKYTGGAVPDPRRQPSFLIYDILRARETPPLGEDPLFWDPFKKRWVYFGEIGDNPGLKSAIEKEVARLQTLR